MVEWLRKLRGGAKSSPTGGLGEAAAATCAGPDRIEVKGESHYQDAFAAIVGPKTHEGYDAPAVAALEPEPHNRYDRNAVAVLVEGRKVGYVNREVAAEIQGGVLAWAQRTGRPVTVDARIVGGWDRGGGDAGHYGIWIHAGLSALKSGRSSA